MAKKIYRYSSCFKQDIIRLIEEEGLSISFQVQHRYGIKGGETIQQWLRKFGKNHLLGRVVQVMSISERDELSILRSEVKTLKLAYAELSIEHKCSEKVIEIADAELGLD